MCFKHSQHWLICVSDKIFLKPQWCCKSNVPFSMLSFLPIKHLDNSLWPATWVIPIARVRAFCTLNHTNFLRIDVPSSCRDVEVDIFRSGFLFFKAPAMSIGRSCWCSFFFWDLPKVNMQFSWHSVQLHFLWRYSRALQLLFISDPNSVQNH